MVRSKKRSPQPKKKSETPRSASKDNLQGPVTIFGVLLTILGLLFTYVTLTPKIIIEKITPPSDHLFQNPFLHEFTIKNSGSTTAYDLTISFLNPRFITVNNITFSTYGDKSKDATINKFSPIENIDLNAEQTCSFTPSPSFTKRYAIQRAVLTLLFKYKDFLHISHSSRFYYYTENKDGILIWKPVGKEYKETVDSWVTER
jgi:hypothetical protein